MQIASSVESIVENADVIWGAKAIGQALGLNERQAFHRLEAGQIPGARKVGKSRAVVASHGGTLSHIAIACRELGVPCVTGVGESLLEGAAVIVDGDAGTVSPTGKSSPAVTRGGDGRLAQRGRPKSGVHLRIIDEHLWLFDLSTQSGNQAFVHVPLVYASTMAVEHEAYARALVSFARLIDGNRSLQGAVVDGVVFPYDAVIPFKLDELTNRVSEFGGDRNFYNSVLLFVMNKAKYDGLPENLKKVIDDNSGAALSRDLGRKWDEWDKIGRAAVLKRNTPIHVIDGADLAAWKKATEPVTAKWIEERNKAGDNGAELVKTAQDLVVKHSK